MTREKDCCHRNFGHDHDCPNRTPVSEVEIQTWLAETRERSTGRLRQYCQDRGHGIVCRNSAVGPGFFCRMCGKQVTKEESSERTKLERVRGAQLALRTLVRDYPKMGRAVRSWQARLTKEAEKLLGKPDDNPTFQAPKL